MYGVLSKKIRVTFDYDDSIWDIPVVVIAYDRAKYYAYEYDNDVEKSLEEDTLPLFESDRFYIIDWFEGCMDWNDVKEVAIRRKDLESKPEVDYSLEITNNCKKELVES